MRDTMWLPAAAGLVVVTLAGAGCKKGTVAASGEPVPPVAQGEAAPARDTAALFESQEAAFAVRFPGVPIQETLTVPTPEGPQLRRVFHYEDDQAAYFIFHTCMPPPEPPRDPEKLLDLSRDSGLQLTGGTLVSEERIVVNGHPGRDVVGKVPDGLISYSRMVVGDHWAFYSLSAVPRSDATTKAALAFLDSFRILPTTERSVCSGRDAIRKR
jgi:hypothetical protein